MVISSIFFWGLKFDLFSTVFSFILERICFNFVSESFLIRGYKFAGKIFQPKILPTSEVTKLIKNDLRLEEKIS